MSESGDRCSRAAAAAIEVVRDECSGLDVEVLEVSDGTLVEVPEEDAERIEDTPTGVEDFERDVRRSDFLAEYLAERAGGTVTADPGDETYAALVHRAAEELYDGLPFRHDDLRRTDVLEMVADQA